MLLSKDMVYEEAELPRQLEKMADLSCRDSYDLDIRREKGLLIISVFDMIKRIVKDITKNIDSSLISARFHDTMDGMIIKTAFILSKKFKTKRVVLSGGVFQNKILTKKQNCIYHINRVKNFLL